METVTDPTPPPAPPRRSRLLWVLITAAVISAGVAGFAWARGSGDDLPEPVTLADLHAEFLGSADVAPPFTVPTLDGGRFSLSDHLAEEGTPVFLNLWASWCLPCRNEMPEIDAAAARYPNIEFVGVAVQDDLVKAAEFATEIGVLYTIGLDERDEVNLLYPSYGLPVSYLISRDGKILHTMFGQLDRAQIDEVVTTWYGG